LRFIEENKEVFPVEKMCKLMRVSGYYYWLKHPVGFRTVKQQQVLVDIYRIYGDSKKRGPQSGLGLRSMAVPGSPVS
jgi:hypothetical protein